MSSTHGPSLSVEELRRALSAADRRARLVPSRLVRRIIKHQRRLGWIAVRRGHRSSWTVATEVALRAVSAEELGLEAGRDWPSPLLLIAAPDAADLARMERGEALLWGWRRLFHAAVHAALEGGPDCGEVRRRIAEIGELAFEEARSVLDRDGWLVAPGDIVAVYREFAAVFLGLARFAPQLLAATFPAIDDLDHVAAVLARDVDGEALFRRSRPAGAADPHPAVAQPAEPPPVPLPVTTRKSETTFRWLIRRADRADRRGNAVRAAIVRARATRLTGPARGGQARGAAEDDLNRLARRLRGALGIQASGGPAWRPALGELLESTTRGFLTIEARLLFDLQKVCVDAEREIFAVDLLGWLVTLGRRPLRRPLPNTRLVRMAKHLRTAQRRLARAKLSPAGREALSGLLQRALDDARGRVRERFRPLIGRALDRSGLDPSNWPERVSFQRMTEELLDLIVDRGFLTMGDVRDAVSRSHLRAADLSGPAEFFRGDRVLRANRRLAISLDGVYRPAEIYLRVLQRLSLLAFGTRTGRWLTLYVALPFGGAYGALVTVHEVLSLCRIHLELLTPKVALGLGVVFLGLIHAPAFRSAVVSGWRAGVAAGRWALVDLPAAVLRLPMVRAVLQSRPFAFLRRAALEPLAVAGGVYVVAARLPADPLWARDLAGLGFLVAALVLNTRLGVEVEERGLDALIRGWRRVRSDLLPGLVRFVVDLFGQFLEGVERLIYAVDEWLRYRAGQGRASFWSKAVFGLFWFFAAYFVRIYLNLLVEPTVNPLKHFPVVTVAAKMILPYVVAWTGAIKNALAPWIGVWLAGPIAGATVIFLPGIAGFIVWEFKENWRLYEANRPRTIRPQAIGHHGETMAQLLRPGFHSGTIPKLFAKLRRAGQDAVRFGQGKATRQVVDALHHVESPIRRFANRDLLAMVPAVEAAEPMAVAAIDLATNRVRLRLAASGDRDPLVIAFEERAGRLIAGIHEPRWLVDLPDDARRPWDLAIEGFLAMAGADAARRGTHGADGPGADRVRPVPPVAWSDWVARWDREMAAIEDLKTTAQPSQEAV